ncbi:MAG: hypothetical protein ACRDD1_21450, partial [Planctomycetia bacterium]
GVGLRLFAFVSIMFSGILTTGCGRAYSTVPANTSGSVVPKGADVADPASSANANAAAKNNRPKSNGAK